MDFFLPRCTAIWLSATGAALVVGRWAAADVHFTSSFDRALSAAASVVLLACLAWAWVVTTVVVTAAMRDHSCGRSHSDLQGPVPLWAQRLVLAACGVALVGAAQAAPAQAVPGHIAPDSERSDAESGARAVAGLPLPDRTLGPRQSSPEPAALALDFARSAGLVTVHAGDSLWSIAERLLGPQTPTERVADLVNRLYDINRAEIGSNPDLILPGHQLRTPLGERPTR